MATLRPMKLDGTGWFHRADRWDIWSRFLPKLYDILEKRYAGANCPNFCVQLDRGVVYCGTCLGKFHLMDTLIKPGMANQIASCVIRDGGKQVVNVLQPSPNK